MYVIFLIWECPDIQVITIHAFHKIYLNIKMSDFDLKMKYFCGVLSIYIYIYKLNNTASNLKQVK